MFVFLKSQVMRLNGSTEVVPNQLVNTNLRQLFVVFGLRVLVKFFLKIIFQHAVSNKTGHNSCKFIMNGREHFLGTSNWRGVVWWFDCATFFNILSTGPGPLHQHPWLKVSLKLPSLGKPLGLLTDYCPWDHSRWPQPCL